MLQQLWELAVLVRTHDQLHQRVASQESGAQPLRHTPQDADHQPGLLPLVGLEMVEPLQNPLLGMLAHGTGVEQNDVRLLWTGRHTVAVGAQDAQHDLRVVEIHLAAVGLHVDQPCPVHRVHSGLWSGF
jgi:hypothetical protein